MKMFLFLPDSMIFQMAGFAQNAQMHKNVLMPLSKMNYGNF